MNKTIIVGLLAMLAIGSFAFVPSLTYAGTTELKGVWIRARGMVTHWGDDPAFGWINTHVKILDDNGTIRKWARAHVAWSTDIPHINSTIPPLENFTFTHYSARLVETVDVRLNYSGYDVYVEGLWNVTKITVTITVYEDGTIEYTRLIEPYLPAPANGTLGIYPWQPHGQPFELDITGMPMLTGLIMRYKFAYIEIKLFDLNDDGKIDIRDIYRVARRFRSAPGMFNYDHDLDLNFDDQVDIGDLTTIAANIGA